jgi:trk system potassium uptake protein TrkH
MKTKTYQIILKEIGNLISLLGFILFVPVIVGVIYGEWYSTFGFLIAAIIIFGLGKSIHFLFRNAIEPQYKHGYIIAALGWLLMTMLGGLTFVYYFAYYARADSTIVCS